nr:hypothetical protein [uncultured bacterium]
MSRRTWFTRCLPALTVAGTLTLTACSAGASKSSCENGRCTATATGEVNISLPDLNSTLEVQNIGNKEAVVEVNDQRATIAAGDTATVGGLSVKVVTVDGDKADFEITRAG